MSKDTPNNVAVTSMPSYYWWLSMRLRLMTREYRSMIRLIVLFVLVSASVYTAAAQPYRGKLILPIRGVLDKDFVVVNHVDHDVNANAIRDHGCGRQTYDGHQGTDFVLKSFRQMDSGVTVIAAAAGVVTAVVDTFPDRNKVSVVSRGYGNYVALLHPNGLATYYAHNRKGSAVVAVGDTVDVGEALALVGSSGNSEDPHVHFEVWQLVDPFEGGCSPTPSLWQDQPPYQTQLRVIDADVTTWPPSLDTIRERPPTATVVKQADSSITFWTLLQGVNPTDRLRIVWLDPELSEWFTYEAETGITSNYFYWWSWINRPERNGTWTCVLYANDTELLRKSFVVSDVVGISNSGVGDVSVTRHGDMLRIRNAATMSIEFFDARGRSIRTTPITDNDTAIILPDTRFMVFQILDNGKPIYRSVIH